jgi:hypothetical protein
MVARRPRTVTQLANRRDHKRKAPPHAGPVVALNHPANGGSAGGLPKKSPAEAGLK